MEPESNEGRITKSAPINRGCSLAQAEDNITSKIKPIYRTPPMGISNKNRPSF